MTPSASAKPYQRPLTKKEKKVNKSNILIPVYPYVCQQETAQGVHEPGTRPPRMHRNETEYLYQLRLEAQRNNIRESLAELCRKTKIM